MGGRVVPDEWCALAGVPGSADGGNSPLKKWGACFPGRQKRLSAVVAVLVAELDVLLVVLVGVDLEGEVGQVDGGVGLAEAAGAGVVDLLAAGGVGRPTGRCRRECTRTNENVAGRVEIASTFVGRGRGARTAGAAAGCAAVGLMGW
jgi:hypothetical protein